MASREERCLVTYHIRPSTFYTYPYTPAICNPSTFYTVHTHRQSATLYIINSTTTYLTFLKPATQHDFVYIHLCTMQPATWLFEVKSLTLTTCTLQHTATVRYYWKPATCNLQLVTSNLQPAICNLQVATCENYVQVSCKLQVAGWTAGC